MENLPKEDSYGFGILTEAQAIVVAKNVKIDQSFHLPYDLGTSFRSYSEQHDKIQIKELNMSKDSANTSELTPDGRTGDQEKVDHVDTSIGGNDFVTTANEELNPDQENERKEKEHQEEEDRKNEVASCQEKKSDSLVGTTVTYFTRVPDQIVLGQGIAPLTPIAARVVGEGADELLDLESVLRVVQGHTFKVFGVKPGTGLGEYQK